MDWSLYIRLSAMMFFQYAVWGAWAPVLAARLMGPLKMSGKQTGWIYGTLFLASIVMPLLAGQIVDRWLATQWFLVGAHLVGGALMLLAARQTRFVPMLIVMGAYSLAFAPTIPLANALMFTHLDKLGVQSFWVFIWIPIAWALAGLGLTAWRRRATQKGDGRDCLILAAVLSFVMAVCCLFQPNTPPSGSPGDALPFLKALDMLKDSQFLIFLIVSLLVTMQLQFYFLGTAPFLEEIGVRHKNVPAAMSIAQIAQAAAMAIVPLLLARGLGFRWALTIGIVLWLGMYLCYAARKPRWLVVGSMALHGLAYTFFIVVGWVYVDKVAPEDIRASAQGLLAVVTFGLGMFLGTQFTGVVMDRLKDGETFRWRAIFLVPCAVLLICAVVFAVLFR